MFYPLLMLCIVCSVSCAAEPREARVESKLLAVELRKFVSREIVDARNDARVDGKPLEYPTGVTTDAEHEEWTYKFYLPLIRVTPEQEQRFLREGFDDAANLKRGDEFIKTLEELKHANLRWTARRIKNFRDGPKGAELELLVRILHVLTKK